MIRTRADRLLAALYCHWEGDTDYDEDAIGAGLPVEKCGFTKYRSILIESTDKGESWHLLSTIASDPKLGREGFCEPGLAELANGDILIVMRNGYKMWPLWQSRSTDGGRSWSEPEKLPMLGVFPCLKLLSNGVLVLASIRPRVFLSLDPTGTGRQWSHHVMLPETRNLAGGCLFIAEEKPNTVLYPYYGVFPLDPPVRGLTKAMHLALMKIKVEKIS